MKDTLTSLDKLIWEQFEKVTQYAHRNYGWDKWDLASLADRVCGAAFIGVGIYTLLLTNHTSPDQQTTLTLEGAVSLLLGPTAPYLMKKTYEIRQRCEYYQLLQGSSVKQPSFSWWRPVMLYGGLNIAMAGAFFLSREELDSKVAGLAALCTSTIFESLTASSYFASQLPKPPSAKKSFWKTVYEGISNRFKPKSLPEPATEPIKIYSGSYQGPVTFSIAKPSVFAPGFSQ